MFGFNRRERERETDRDGRRGGRHDFGERRGRRPVHSRRGGRRTQRRAVQTREGVRNQINLIMAEYKPVMREICTFASDVEREVNLNKWPNTQDDSAFTWKVSPLKKAAVNLSAEEKQAQDKALIDLAKAAVDSKGSTHFRNVHLNKNISPPKNTMHYMLLDCIEIETNCFRITNASARIVQLSSFVFSIF